MPKNGRSPFTPSGCCRCCWCALEVRPATMMHSAPHGVLPYPGFAVATRHCSNVALLANLSQPARSKAPRSKAARRSLSKPGTPKSPQVRLFVPPPAAPRGPFFTVLLKRPSCHHTHTHHRALPPRPMAPAMVSANSSHTPHIHQPLPLEVKVACSQAELRRDLWRRGAGREVGRRSR